MKLIDHVKVSAGSASNSSYHFTFHFNYSGIKNPYGLEGPTGIIGGGYKDQCCLMQELESKTTWKNTYLANISGVKD